MSTTNGHVPNKIKDKIKAELESILKLEDTWHEYADKAIPKEMLNSFSSCMLENFPSDLPVPFLVPNHDGGINLDWDINEDVIIYIEVMDNDANREGDFSSLPLHIIDISDGEKVETAKFNMKSQEDWLGIGKLLSSKSR